MRKLSAILLVLLFGIVGCGGGSSDSDDTPPPANLIVEGVAAAGAPLVGTVSLKDSQGNPIPALTTRLDSVGGFSFDLTDLDLVPPFFLKAEGMAGNTGYTLHSVVTTPGRANINPLTEAQIRLATDQNPTALYEDPSSSSLTNEDMKSALNAAAKNLQEMLRPLLEAWSMPDLNPITCDYTANGTGLDSLFDVMEVTCDNDAIEVVDRASETTLATVIFDPTGGVSAVIPILPAAVTELGSTISDLDNIKPFLGKWLTDIKTISASFATGNMTEDEALAAIAPYYEEEGTFGVNNGKTLAQEEIEILEDAIFWNAIQSISNVSIVNYDSSTEVYKIRFLLHLQLHGAAATYPSALVAVEKSGDSWKITGNGYYADDEYDTVVFKTANHIFSDQSNQVTVVDFELEDEQNQFASAVVEGPGLPDGGLDFSKNGNDGELYMDHSLMAPVRFNPDGTPIEYEVEWNGYALTDEVIAAMPDICTYKKTYHFTDGRDDEVHIVTLPAKPLLSSQIPSGHLPVINTPLLPNNLNLTWAEANLQGQSVEFNYSTPPANETVHVGLEAWIEYIMPNGFDSERMETWVDDGLLGINQTKVMVFPSPPESATLQAGEVEIECEDIFWRKFKSVYNFR